MTTCGKYLFIDLINIMTSLSDLVPLSTLHFEKYYRRNKYFGGVYSRDFLDIIQIEDNKRKKFYIINLDDETGPGTHWVVLFMSEVPIYFDSSGVYPPKELNFIKNLYFIPYRIQATNSRICGLYCLYFINEALKGRKYMDIVLDVDKNDYNENERRIYFHFSKVLT